VGKAFATRLQQGSLELGRILEKLPDLMKMLGPEYFRFRDFPGADKVAKILSKVRDVEFPYLMDDDEELTPDQAIAQNAALKQQIQQMKQALGAAQQEAQSGMQAENLKQQAALAKSQGDNAARVQVAEITSASRLQETQIEAQARVLAQAMESQLEQLLAKMNQAWDARMKLLDSMLGRANPSQEA
jgi:hypothetical protein